ncbi:hypothetical protein DY023_05230 [Microbacterium bovistercoris]|uniref:Glycosyltransferase RgtA/B/C/D-like domain-containing protein n=1 Tax=Microbacterium bovistercoris TaxID=2293570 RepID=A0A371NVV6_9MICO|nr:hypothetical protein [Microbacterium bovistercoris]REJ06756.1 hypothetical protein DY023_05230 [Microbacterium bovistercoris]
MRGGWREAAGWAAAVGVAVFVAAQMAASARSELLFRDGDSLVVALYVRSVLEGQPQDWAFSTVLFMPESACFALLRLALPWLGLNALFAMNAVVNLVAFYGALRLAAGRRGEGRSPVMWTLLAFSAFCLLVVLETSPSRDALEPASLLLTTTYYSATVIAVIVSVGLIRRRVEGGWSGIPYVLGLVAAVSTLSNPLFAAWATVPLGLLLGMGAVRRRQGALAPLLALAAGTLAGFLARIPFSAWIANTGTGYARPSEWAQALQYYAGLASERLTSPGGVAAALILVALLAFCVRRTLRCTGGARIVGTAGWLIPVLVVIGAIALGTHAARYLQPIAFVPVLSLVALPRSIRMPQVAARMAVAASAVVVLVLAGVSAPRLASSASADDRDLRCVTDWVDASDRTGAGQFWTVRLPKLQLDDPARLVQVDHTLRGYAWLVNRTDFEVSEVTFLVEDDASQAWELPPPGVTPDTVIPCGRYRILDYAGHPLPLGPQRS